MSRKKTDHDYLTALRDYYAAWRSVPSYDHLMGKFDLKSKSAVAKVLKRLCDAGLLKRTPQRAWVPTREFFARPIAEVRVPAGTPATLADASTDTLLVDDFLIDKPSHTVLVPVKGDSMIDAGIHSGDVVVVDKSVRAKPGDIVVAIVDNEFTIKTLALERGKSVLRPANLAYPVIRPRATLEIFGVVVGLARKYRR